MVKLDFLFSFFNNLLHLSLSLLLLCLCKSQVSHTTPLEPLRHWIRPCWLQQTLSPQKRNPQSCLYLINSAEFALMKLPTIGAHSGAESDPPWPHSFQLLQDSFHQLSRRYLTPTEIWENPRLSLGAATSPPSQSSSARGRVALSDMILHLFFLFVSMDNLLVVAEVTGPKGQCN